jgi:hypothetical protein
MINIQPHLNNIHQEDYAILAMLIAATAAKDSFVGNPNHGWPFCESPLRMVGFGVTISKFCYRSECPLSPKFDQNCVSCEGLKSSI